MLKYGKVKEVDNDKCLARVEFEEDGIVSHWLQIPQAQTQAVKAFSSKNVGENVACLMDENCEQGVIVGSIYDTNNAAPGQSSNEMVGIQKGNDFVVYNVGGRQFRVVTGEVQLQADSLMRVLHSDAMTISHNGNEFIIRSNNKVLKDLIIALLDILISHTHPTPAGPSGPPTEAPSLTSNKTDFQTFFG